MANDLPADTSCISDTNRKRGNPFARFEVNENRGENTVVQTTIRRIIAPSQPAVVYRDDSKSAVILSTLLNTNVPKRENRSNVAQRKRASVVPLGRLRDTVAQLVRPGAHSLQRQQQMVSTSASEQQKMAPMPKLENAVGDSMGDGVVVEEINLISDDDEEDDEDEQQRDFVEDLVAEERDALEEEKTEGSQEKNVAHVPLHGRSTGVALFDAFTGEDDEYYESGHDDEEELEEDGHADMNAQELSNMPKMVNVGGAMQPWWKRLPDFVPISELANGKDPRNGSPVFVNYMSQFKGTKIAQLGTSGKVDRKRKSQNAHWVSKDGVKTFVTEGGENLSGRAAYIAYKKSKPSDGKKISTKKRRRKRSKNK